MSCHHWETAAGGDFHAQEHSRKWRFRYGDVWPRDWLPGFAIFVYVACASQCTDLQLAWCKWHSVCCLLEARHNLQFIIAKSALANFRSSKSTVIRMNWISLVEAKWQLLDFLTSLGLPPESSPPCLPLSPGEQLSAGNEGIVSSCLLQAALPSDRKTASWFIIARSGEYAKTSVCLEMEFLLRVEMGHEPASTLTCTQATVATSWTAPRMQGVYCEPKEGSQNQAKLLVPKTILKLYSDWLLMQQKPKY